MFSAAKFVVAGAIVALFGGFLLPGLLPPQPNEEQQPAASTGGPGTFSPAGSLVESRRFGHDAIPLPDGRVLVVGGVYWDGEVGGERSIAAAEVWDPDAMSFSPAGTLGVGRGGETSTRLPDGRVLMVGGEVSRGDGIYFEAEAQVWDPTTDSFRAAGSLEQGRAAHFATLLPDGRVLVVGGWSGGPIAAAEVWDPATATFSPAGSLEEARGPGLTAVILLDGRVLVVGGSIPGGPVGSAEVWDPATATFSPAGTLAEMTPAHPLAEPRSRYTATLLQDGRVLFVGGGHVVDPDQVGEFRHDLRAEVWEPESMSFGSGGSLAEGRWGHTATLLPDGRVLVIGGWRNDDELGHVTIAAAEIWDPATQTFSPAGSLAVRREGHRATLLTDGRILVIGGNDGNSAIAAAEIWDPATQTFNPAGSLSQVRVADSATSLPDGRVLTIGSSDDTLDGPFVAEVWSE